MNETENTSPNSAADRKQTYSGEQTSEGSWNGNDLQKALQEWSNGFANRLYM